MKKIGFALFVFGLAILFPHVVHAAFQTPDFRVNTGVAPGTYAANDLSISSLPDGHVYVAWGDLRDGQGGIFFNYSYDYGLSWQATDQRIDFGNNAGGGAMVCALSDGHVFVVWADKRNGNSDVYLNTSTDFGITWQTDNERRLDTDTPGAAGSSPIGINCYPDGHVYVAWQDRRNGADDIYFSVSSDYGNTWLANDIRLDTGSVAGSSLSWWASMCSTSNGTIYVVWEDERNGLHDIYLNRSWNYGITWMTPDIRIDRGDALGEHYSSAPSISCEEDGYAYVAWEDPRNGSGDILLNLSTDYGLSWLSTPKRVDLGDAAGATLSMYPEIASTSDGHVYVVWEDDRYSLTTVLFNRSVDHGSNWSVNSIALDQNPGTYATHAPKIVASDIGDVDIVWVQELFNPMNIAFTRSQDFASTWLASPLYADTGDTVGTASLFPAISINSMRAYIIWLDKRNGFDYPDVYFNVWNESINGPIPTLNEYGIILLIGLLLIFLLLRSQMITIRSAK